MTPSTSPSSTEAFASTENLAQVLILVADTHLAPTRLSLPLYGEVLVERPDLSQEVPWPSFGSRREGSRRVSVTFRDEPTAREAAWALARARRTNTTGFLWSRVEGPVYRGFHSPGVNGSRLDLYFLPSVIGAGLHFLPQELLVLLTASVPIEKYRTVLEMSLDLTDVMMMEGVVAELGMKRELVFPPLEEAVNAIFRGANVPFSDQDFTHRFLQALADEVSRVAPMMSSGSCYSVVRSRVAREFFGPVLASTEPLPAGVFAPVPLYGL